MKANQRLKTTFGVVSDGSDTLKLRLAKELKGLTSATFTNGGNNTVINGDGMTINRAGGNAVSLTKDGLNNGGNKITNVADGTDLMMRLINLNWIKLQAADIHDWYQVVIILLLHLH